MHSWVFRNRAQLRLIYGSTAPEQDVETDPECAAPAVDGGSIEREGNDVILTPMASVAR